jgi:DNA-binding GntR family transcriptional regulator
MPIPVPEPPLSLGEQIANGIAEDILQEKFRPGDAIPEQHLAQQYQVSRGPIREALRILEKEGVVQILPRRGARVTQLSVVEVDEIFVIRAHLFGLAASLFTERAAPQHLHDLNALLKQMKALGPDEATTHAEVSAQMALVLLEQCGNHRLRAMVLQLARQVARYTQLGLQARERRRASIASWRVMLRAIREREPHAAENIGREMILNTQQEVITQLKAAQPAASMEVSG